MREVAISKQVGNSKDYNFQILSMISMAIEQDCFDDYIAPKIPNYFLAETNELFENLISQNKFVLGVQQTNKNLENNSNNQNHLLKYDYQYHSNSFKPQQNALKVELIQQKGSKMQTFKKLLPRSLTNTLPFHFQLLLRSSALIDKRLYEFQNKKESLGDLQKYFGFKFQLTVAQIIKHISLIDPTFYEIQKGQINIILSIPSISEKDLSLRKRKLRIKMFDFYQQNKDFPKEQISTELSMIGYSSNMINQISYKHSKKSKNKSNKIKLKKMFEDQIQKHIKQKERFFQCSIEQEYNQLLLTQNIEYRNQRDRVNYLTRVIVSIYQKRGVQSMFLPNLIDSVCLSDSSLSQRKLIKIVNKIIKNEKAFTLTKTNLGNQIVTIDMCKTKLLFEQSKGRLQRF